MYENRVLARLDDWLLAAQNVGSAYALAADRHQHAVGDRARRQALNEAIMYGVLTAACAGGLGWLATTSVAEGIQRITGLVNESFENAQDTLVVMVGEGIDVYQAATQPQPQAVSRNPLVYQNGVTGPIINKRRQVLERFDTWLGDLLNASMSSYSDRARLEQFRREIEAWTQRSNRLSGGAGLPEVEIMAQRLERDFWAEWIKQNLVSQGRSPRTGLTHNTYFSPGGAVEARLNALGITRDSGVGDFGWWTSDGEVAQLVIWARAYRVQPLIPAEPS